MVNENQVRKLSKEYRNLGNIVMSAMKSGMHRHTASKYLKSGQLPEEMKKKREGRTRIDPFESETAEITSWLKRDSRLEAKSLLYELQEKYPGKYKDSQLRTLQRKVKAIRGDLYREREIMFDQKHEPGQKMQLDWTWCNELSITIQGREFKHKLCHCVLTYSGWEWATICLSESYLSLASGFQEAVFKLGKVPKILQTDNSSAATHRIEKDKVTRDFNDKYLSFTEHHGITPQTSNIAKPNENGSVESLNGHLKRRMNQKLILRGSRDFSSLLHYQNFLEGVLNTANAPRLLKLEEELFLMEEVAPIRLPEYHEERCKVSKGSLVNILKTIYSVPSMYIGTELSFKVFEQFIEVYKGRGKLFSMPREVNRKAQVNYKHIIHSLRRKPGSFSGYKYRECLFPAFVFRCAYDRLHTLYGNRLADREYLEILYLASTQDESKVSGCLQDVLADPKIKFSLFELKKDMGLSSKIQQKTLNATLNCYDALMGGSYAKS